MEQWVVWLTVVIFLVIIEVATINLTTIWFVISGMIALALTFLTDSFLIQFGVFVTVGVVLLLTTKSWLERTLKPRKEDTNAGRVIGLEGIVTEKITKNEMGEVKVDGKRWTAYASETIEVDSVVNILDINGVKLKVEQVKGE